MKRICILIFYSTIVNLVAAQSIDKIINVAEVERIERVLSHDSMQGRRALTPGIDKAANFIASEFKKSRLQYFPGLQTFRQDFTILATKMLSADGNVNGQSIEAKSIISISTEPVLSVNNNSGYEKVVIGKGADFRKEISKYIETNKNIVVFIDTSFSRFFPRLRMFGQQSFKKSNNIVFILTPLDPVSFSFNLKQEISEQKLANVVGILPGKSKKNEYVIFSAHYDHLGIGKPDAKGDSIYNGANDDAAGTTAVIMLSKYFKKLKKNKRTLVFVAFTAEEIGGFGSQYFSKQLDPDKVVAMFNIEMIGTTSKWGTNSAYITGYEKSDFGKILQSNLNNSKFQFQPDPYTKQDLFYRSDNATLAALGVPAHTISTAKMEEVPNNEPNYHKQSDEIGTLDIPNMAEIIKAIALSSKTIIRGKDKPSRVAKR